MGTGNSKKDAKKSSPPASKPKTMPYKRQFSSDLARQNQQETYTNYRQATIEKEKQLATLNEEEKKQSNDAYDQKFKDKSVDKTDNKTDNTASTNPSSSSNVKPTTNTNDNKSITTPDVSNLNLNTQAVAKYDNDILDPKKYKPPPSPAVLDNILPTTTASNDNDFVNRKLSIKENDDDDNNDNDIISDDDDQMTDAQALQIKQNTERALLAGTNLLSDDVKDNDNTTATATTITTTGTGTGSDDNKDVIDDNNQATSNLSAQILSQQSNVSNISNVSDVSNHSRVDSSTLVSSQSQTQLNQTLIWGYCELTRKQLDEDQAAFLTWTHPFDGFVHSWAIFDGHGGYETALYSAQHFLKYVQKYHLTRSQKQMNITEWKPLMNEIFLKFDQHIGNLNIRGGSTVVIVLLVRHTLIIANAGDARAIMSYSNGKSLELSHDHTPMNDYDRLYRLCKNKDNYKKISRFFRLNPKNETYSDIQKLPPHQIKKAPFISREQDKSRLLGTIGVARGFGDFSLSVFGFRSIKLKPFLSAKPYVFIKELTDDNILDTDIMCIACDGVFDVMTNQEVIDILRREIFYRKPKPKTNIIIEDKEMDTPDANTNTNTNNTPPIKEKAIYTKEPNLNINSSMIDRSCGFLGLRSYAKGTMDDVSIFTVPLRQIFDFVKLNK